MERSKEIHNLTRRYNLPSEFQNIDLTTDMPALKKYCQELNDKFKKELDQVHKKNEKELTLYFESLDDLKKQKNTAEDRKLRGAERLSELSIKKTQLQNKIPTTSSFDNRLKITKEELEEEEEQLNNNELSDYRQKFQQQYEQTKLEKENCERKLLELSETTKILNQQASARVKLDLIRKQIKKHEEEYMKL